MKKGLKTREDRRKMALTVVFTVICVIYVLPILIVLINSFKTNASSLLKSLKWRENAILLNGSPVTVRAVAHEGDVLTADVSDPPAESPVIPVYYPLDILWEDEDLLILNKPAGLTVHSAALTEETVTVAGAVAHYLGCDTFHPVNRLDRGVTGVMVVAKNGYMHQRCMAILHTDDFRREYRGICDGVPQLPAGTIDLPISRQPGSLLKRSIDPEGLPPTRSPACPRRPATAAAPSLTPTATM